MNGVNVLMEITHVPEHAKMKQMAVDELVLNALVMLQKHAVVKN